MSMAKSADNAYDVFFSYNSSDHAAVLAVADALRERGRRVFLDRWYLVPGRPWPQALEQILGSCRAVAIFLGPHGMGRWQQSEAYLALDRQAHADAFPVVPVLLPGADPALGFLSLNTWVDLRSSMDDPVSLSVLDAAVRGEPPGPDAQQRVAATLASVSPYRGLRPFREEDAAFFFGREAFSAHLAKMVETQNFVAVVGASGSGKSSVVRAGLVPRLRGERSPGCVWDIITLVPSDRPFHALAAALMPLLEPDLDEIARLVKTRELAEYLAGAHVSLRDLAARVLEKQSGTDRLLLIADQWEEIYTLCREEKLRRSFIDSLLEATESLPLTVVVTLRGDFFGHVLDYRPLVDRIDRAVVHIPPMNRDELTRAVEEPAKRVALSFEPGLVDRMLDDVDGEPGRLPLLEFALTELWEKRSGTKLRHETYDAMGQIQGAVARRAEGVYERLEAPEQEQVRRIFVQLVRPGEGAEDTRRRATFAELGPESRPLIKELADNRLVVTGRDASTGEETVEVAHEALIRSWNDLRRWMDEDRVFRGWQERLRTALRQWQASGRQDDLLLRGAPLAEAEQRLAERPAEVSDAERQFVQASVELRDREQAIRDRQRKKIVRWSVTAALLMTLLAIATGVAWVDAWKTNEDLEKSLVDSFFNQLYSARIASDRGSSDEALAWYLRAYQTAPATRQELKTSARHLIGGWGRSAGRVLPHGGPVRAVAFSPDGQTVLTGSAGANTARLWDAQTGEPRGEPLEHIRAVRVVAFSPDGQTVLTGSDDKTARLWDAQTGKPRGEPLEHAASVIAVAFSPDGQTILTASLGGAARLWDTQTRQPRGKALKHNGSVHTARFSPDGQAVLTGGSDGAARLWDAQTGEPRGETLQHLEAVNAVAFSPDGMTILTGSSDRTARFWDVQTGRSKGRSLQHQHPVTAVAFSPDGTTALTVSDYLPDISRFPAASRPHGSEGTAHLWDVQTGQQRGVPLTHEGRVNAVVFRPDGRMVLTGSADGTARLWDAQTGTQRGEFAGHEGGVIAVAFSPDSRMAFTGSTDGTARLWDALAGQPREELLLHHGDVAAVFSADGPTVLGSADGNAQLWDVHTHQPRGEPLQHGGDVHAVAFGPQGRMVLVASEDGTGLLWDTQTGQPCRKFQHVRGDVLSVALSPDGKMALTGSSEGTARLWHVPTAKPHGEPLQHGGEIRAVAFSPDGNTVLTGSNGITQLWDVQTGETRGESLKQPGAVYSTAFSPDSKLILIATSSSTVLWDTRTGKPCGEPLKHGGWAWAVAFSPDGLTGLTGDSSRMATLWDLQTGQPRGKPLQHRGKLDLVTVAFSPDGQWVLTGSRDIAARLWEVPPPALDEPERLQLSIEVRTGLYFDERGNLKRLNFDQWMERRARRAELGGPCDTPTWEEYHAWKSEKN